VVSPVNSSAVGLRRCPRLSTLAAAGARSVHRACIHSGATPSVELLGRNDGFSPNNSTLGTLSPLNSRHVHTLDQERYMLIG
jgi:hypothetical protein